MKQVIIIGASGHAAEIQEYLLAYTKSSGKEKYRIAGFLDDDPAAYGRYAFKAPDLGPIKEHKILKNNLYIIGIANTQYRRMIVESFLADSARFITVIHPSAYISDSASVGQGCIVGPNVNIGPNVVVGDFTLLNARCSLGHDTVIGKYNYISPNVCFSGGTSVGDDNLFGINSATKPGIRVGNRNKIEAGMILDREVQDDSVVFFRYKERVIAIPKT